MESHGPLETFWIAMWVKGGVGWRSVQATLCLRSPKAVWFPTGCLVLPENHIQVALWRSLPFFKVTFLNKHSTSAFKTQNSEKKRKRKLRTQGLKFIKRLCKWFSSIVKEEHHTDFPSGPDQQQVIFPPALTHPCSIPCCLKPLSSSSGEEFGLTCAHVSTVGERSRRFLLVLRNWAERKQGS